MNAKAVRQDSKGKAAAKRKLTPEERAAQIARRRDKVQAELKSGAARFSKAGSCGYLNCSLRTLDNIRASDPTFPRSTNPDGVRLMFLRADLDAWLASKKAPGAVLVEPTSLARAHGRPGQVRSVAEPRNRRATDKPAPTLKTARQRDRVGA